MRVGNENKYSHNSEQGMVISHKAPAWHRCPASEGGDTDSYSPHNPPEVPQTGGWPETEPGSKFQELPGSCAPRVVHSARGCPTSPVPVQSTRMPMSRAPAAEHSPKVPAQPPAHNGHQGTALQEGGPQRSWQGEVLLSIIPEQRGTSQQTFGEPLQVALEL